MVRKIHGRGCIFHVDKGEDDKKPNLRNNTAEKFGL